MFRKAIFPARFMLASLLAMTLLVAAPMAAAQKATTTGEGKADFPVSAESVKNKLDALASDSQLDKDARATLENLYRKAIANLQTAADYESNYQAFVDAEKSAAGEAAKIRARTEQKKSIDPATTLKLSGNETLEELEARLQKETADLTALETKLTKAKEALKYHADRPAIIRQRLIEANRAADGLASELQAPASSGDSPQLVEAKQWAKETGAMVVTREIQMLDQELLSQPMRMELLQAELEGAEESVRIVGGAVDRLEEIINNRRKEQASQVQQEAAQALQQAEGQHPLVQQLAERNSELSNYINDLANDLKTVDDDEERISNRTQRIDKDFDNARKKLEIAGMSQILGRVLQEQRRALPDTGPFRKKARQLESRIAEVSLQQIEFKEELADLRDLDRYVDNYLAQAQVDETQRETLRTALRSNAANRVEYLDKVISMQNTYLRALGELDFAQNRLLETAEAYDKFLAERLLWIRSASTTSLANVALIPGQLRELLSPQRWMGVVESLWRQSTSHIYMALTFIILAILFWKERNMRAALRASGKYVGKPTQDRMLVTVQAMGLTLLLALPWPLLMVSLGLQLQDDIAQTAFTRAVAMGLLLIAEAFMILRAFTIMCNPEGVAVRHFHWPAEGTRQLRRHVELLMLTFLPLGFIGIVVNNSDISTDGVGVGRLSFAMMMLVLVLFFFRVLNPSRGALQEFFSTQKRSALLGIRYGWLVLAVLIPVTATVLSLLGYQYSARTLVRSMMMTFWLVLALIVIQQFVVRWLLVIRGRLALQAAREKRKAMLAARQADDNPASKDEAALDIDEPVVDIDALSGDSLRLLNLTILLLAAVGIWFIWSDVFPAFNVFERFTLYQHEVNIDGEISYKTVTVFDIGLSLLTIVVITLLTKRLPAFLEILLRQRSGIMPGTVYAVKSLTTYALVGIGVSMVFKQLGGTWSEIKWIFAALGVGIGFGLQEIVANFISGLIILFERPIRVGDVVTVGDVSGTVTRIRIRATTIRDWDRKELLVPNKEFITARLLNWSLSDNVTRLMVPVGIAYGSDVPLAMKLMEQAARENNKIITDPPPVITFDSFGDNALLLTARVYIDNLDHRISVVSELHATINDKFNAAGIVIAFPQRDVHLDTSRPLEIRVRRDQDGDEA